MCDFRAEPAELREAMREAAARVLDSGWFILGAEVERFEREWAAHCGARHAVGVANGMDAIEIALRALGIGKGDEVIAPAMTAFATVLAILRAGATPVLADVDARTALLDPASAARCVGPRTRAVVLVHLYGRIEGMTQWAAFCRSHGLRLIEDCAQSHGALQAGRAGGRFGDAGAYSFYPTKNLGAAGDGGALVTDDAEIAERARKLRNYGQSDRYRHALAGLNSRLDEVQAAILSARLRWLAAFNARRREVAAAYRAGIRNPRVGLLSPASEEAAHDHHLFVVTCERRAALQEHLAANGVETLIHYPVPIHGQEPCRDAQRDPEGLAASERHAATCLSIPCHPQLSDAEVERVVALTNAFEA